MGGGIGDQCECRLADPECRQRCVDRAHCQHANGNPAARGEPDYRRTQRQASACGERAGGELAEPPARERGGEHDPERDRQYRGALAPRDQDDARAASSGVATDARRMRPGAIDGSASRPKFPTMIIPGSTAAQAGECRRPSCSSAWALGRATRARSSSATATTAIHFEKVILRSSSAGPRVLHVRCRQPHGPGTDDHDPPLPVQPTPGGHSLFPRG